MNLRVAAIQMQHGDSLEENLERASGLLARASDAGVGLALLPEYFAASPGAPALHAADAKAVEAFLADASRRHGIVIGGNVIEPSSEGPHNVGVIYARGARVAHQRKVHPMPRESEGGILGGVRLDTFEVEGIPTGILVCADILYPEAARILALKGAQLLLNPVMSAYHAVDPTKAAREALYVARAYDAGAFVLKAGGFRRPVGGRAGIAGRSLVTAPWGVLARYRDDFEEELLVAELDFDELSRFRKGQERFPSRRPETYGDLS